MPGGQREDDDKQVINTNATSSDEFWSKHRDDINFNQLEKFWSELSQQARQDLLKIDKQTLFEQVRKNMYCSRCTGLLHEGYMQIVMHGKSLKHGGGGGKLHSHKLGISKDHLHGGPISTKVCPEETKNPFVHPWGGLISTRDGALTLLGCYMCSKSLKGLQNVFDCARARERERELHYPDACGGGGRGWISQGIASYGRGHGTREACALHTARLSCGTLVDFWLALGEETRQSLLRMKEEDFIERLMYRFDSKRFCRDCRRNVIREFKDLKELKRTRTELRCTDWFCVADTAFQCEVSNDTIFADWHQTFIDSIETYHHFEWAVGSGEGKSDILEYENVGVNGSVEVNGLDLAGLSACYITLRAWKLDGRCSEFSVKAHALKGRQCVHCRLVVGDGYVSITDGESVRKFFEHAEEAEEEEDDDSVDKDGNDLDGECSRPQRHAKSPELAREFLLDAAAVIFKEQVEKAYREGTARQNAYSTFVCLALKLLEDRIHIACKEIVTLEKQMKLLEEEEKEKRQEEERKERKRMKEREKKLRRKERMRFKDKKCSESSESPVLLDVSEEVPTSYIDEESNSCNRDSVSDTGDANLSKSAFPGVLDESSSNDYTASESLTNAFDGEFTDVKDDRGLFMVDSFKGARRKWPDRRRSTGNGAVAYKSEPRYYDVPSDVNSNSRQSRATTIKFSTRSGGPRFGQKVQCSSIRPPDRSELHPCGCNQHNYFRTKVEPHPSTGRYGCESRSATQIESAAADIPKTVHRTSKFNPVEYTRDNCGRGRSKISNYASALVRDLPYTKQVWEPVEPHKRYPRSNSDSDVTLRSCFKKEEIESDKTSTEVCSDQNGQELPQYSLGGSLLGNFRVETSSQNYFHADALYHAKEAAEEENDSSLRSNLNGVSDFPPRSSSDNCSSCLSEGDTNTPSPSHPNLESSYTSDSEDSGLQSDGRRGSECLQNGLSNNHKVENERVSNGIGEGASSSAYSAGHFSQNVGIHSGNFSANLFTDNAEDVEVAAADVASIQQGVHPSIDSQKNSFPDFQGPPNAGYYHPSAVTWPAAPTNGLRTYPHPNNYLLPSPFGYSLNGDSPFCMQYDPVQHLASPFMNSNQFSVYQPAPKANYLNSQDQSSAFIANGVKDSSGDTRRENVANGGHLPTEISSKVGIAKASSARLAAGNAGFSLFQFGGPVALANYQSGIQSVEDEKGGGHIDGVCSRIETTIEEYNLFAARNPFSFHY